MPRLETNMGPVEIVGATKVHGDEVLIGTSRYAPPYQDRLALLAVLPTGEVYGKLSINVVEAILTDGEFVVSHDIPPRDAKRLLNCGAPITDTGRMQKYGFCEQPVYKLGAAS